MSRRPGHRCEPLERRVLMAFGPLGPESHVNTTTARNQVAPAVAVDDSGDYVVAWASYGQNELAEPSHGSIYVRRYNAAGTAQSGEIPVNAQTAGDRRHPAVAIDADGDFVVSWTTNGAGIFARRFNAAGTPQGAEFKVNAVIALLTFPPSVAMDADGDFVVAWAGFDPADVYARRYNAAGTPQGGEFRVNTANDNIQELPAVAMDADGDFVVTWDSFGQDGSSFGVVGQRYSETGAKQGNEFVVNTTVAGDQGFSSVAMDDAGDFVVAFRSASPVAGDSYDVYARRFNADGAGQGNDFLVNTHTPAFQAADAVTMDADGDFVVTWTSFGQDVPAETQGAGVYARRYTAAGAAQGGEFRVNTHTPGSQANSSVSMDADGDFVVAWVSGGQEVPAEPTNFGVYAQRFGEGVDTVAPRVAAVFVSGAAWAASFRQSLQAAGMGSSPFGFQVPGGAAQFDELPWTNVNRVHVRFSEDVVVDAGDLAIRGVNTASYALNAAAFAYDATTFTATWALAGNASFGNDKVLLDVNADAGGVTDKATPAANRLDGEWTNGTSAFPSGNGAAGGDFRFQLNMLPGDVNRSGGSVNSIDLQLERNRQFTSTANPGNPPNAYTSFHDVDGSGNTNSIDLQLVRNRQFTQLPAGNPSVVAGARAALFGVTAVRRSGAVEDLEEVLG